MLWSEKAKILLDFLRILRAQLRVCGGVTFHPGDRSVITPPLHPAQTPEL